MSHGSVAKSERLRKAAHPDNFCANAYCLWRLSSGPCPKHTAEERCDACRVTLSAANRRAVHTDANLCIECAAWLYADAPASALYDNEAGR